MPGIPWDRATTGDATWLQTFYNSNTALNKWATPGGDFSPTVSGVTGFGADGTSATWSSTAQMVADVQGWLNNPTTNFGWVLKSDEIQDIGIYIDSSEATNRRSPAHVDDRLYRGCGGAKRLDQRRNVCGRKRGTATATFDVALSTASSQTVTVNYATANGTAIAETDYQPTAARCRSRPARRSRA